MILVGSDAVCLERAIAHTLSIHGLECTSLLGSWRPRQKSTAWCCEHTWPLWARAMADSRGVVWMQTPGSRRFADLARLTILRWLVHESKSHDVPLFVMGPDQVLCGAAQALGIEWLDMDTPRAVGRARELEGGAERYELPPVLRRMRPDELYLVALQKMLHQVRNNSLYNDCIFDLSGEQFGELFHAMHCQAQLLPIGELASSLASVCAEAQQLAVHTKIAVQCGDDRDGGEIFDDHLDRWQIIHAEAMQQLDAFNKLISFGGPL